MTDAEPISVSARGAHPQLGAHPPLSRLGLGAWAFGRTGWGAQDDRDSRAAILRAVELGVNWIDTAAVYGDGHAEELLGTAVQELPAADRPLLFTKCGLRIDPASGRTFRDLSPASLRQECEASLRRLHVERIDLYQIHWPTADGDGLEDAWETLSELATAGKVRWIGVSNFSAAQLDRCAALRPVDSIQFPLSLLARETVAELTHWAAGHGAAAITYSPLASGLLSGRFSAQRLTALDEGDWRRRRNEFQPPAFARTLALVERLRPLAASLDASVAELAIAWALAWPHVTGAIVGARSASQVEGWIGATGLRLDGEMLEQIATALGETAAGLGPARPAAGRGAP